MLHPQMKTIRAKKLGVLIRDAREASGKSIKECAAAVGVTPGIFGSFERGTRAPSLPQLEVYAYYLNVPMDHFWGSHSISEQPPVTSKLDVDTLLAERQIAIGGKLEAARTEANLSLKELGSRAGISPRRVKSFETGKNAIPIPELEGLVNALGLSIREFMDAEGPMQVWRTEKEVVDEFLELPPELQAFVCKPINRPFLEVAQRLSQMPVDQLREVAEGLLEITF
jgi:transcriptional regulator with XRE-family HTH domain